MPSREIFWNIQFGELVYLFGALLVVAVAYGLYRRLRLWRMGSEDDRLRDIPGRVRAFLIKTKADGLWHKRIVRNRYAGVMHLLIFGGFLVLLMGPFLDFTSEHVYQFMEGNVYLGVSLMLDVGGLLVLAGLGMAAYRRYVMRPSKLNNVLDDAVALSLLAGIIVTGYILEGLRIAASELDVHPGWSVWSPVGFVFAKAFYPLGHERQPGAAQDLLVGPHAGLDGRNGLRRPQLHEAGAYHRFTSQHVPADARPARASSSRLR